MNLKRWVAWLLCVGMWWAAALAACRSAPQPAASKPAAGAAPASVDGGAGGEISFEAASQREQSQLEAARLASADGRVQLRVLSHGAPAIEKTGEQAYRVKVPIGSGVDPMLCFVSTAQPGAAESMIQILSNVSRFQNRKVAELDSGVIVGGHPYLYTEVSYTTGEGDHKRHGVLKSYVVSLHMQGVICVHHEPGYRKTLRRVVESIAESIDIKRSEPVPIPRYHAVSTLSSQGRRVGFDETLVLPRTGGGSVMVRNTSLLLTGAPGQLTARDEAIAEDTDREGRLVSANYVASRDSEREYNIMIERGKGARYQVSGTYRGKDLKSTVSPRAPLLGGIAQANLIARSLVSGRHGQDELSLQDYVPATDPAALTTITIRRLPAADGESPYEVSSGAFKQRAVFDDHGFAKKALTRMGGVDIEKQRVFAEGTPP